jgi:hypothetical protein
MARERLATILSVPADRLDLIADSVQGLVCAVNAAERDRADAIEALRMAANVQAQFRSERDAARASLSRVRGETLEEAARHFDRLPMAAQRILPSEAADILRHLAEPAPGTPCGYCAGWVGHPTHNEACIRDPIRCVGMPGYTGDARPLPSLASSAPGDASLLCDVCAKPTDPATAYVECPSCFRPPPEPAPAEPARDDGGAGPDWLPIPVPGHPSGCNAGAPGGMCCAWCPDDPPAPRSSSSAPVTTNSSDGE